MDKITHHGCFDFDTLMENRARDMEKDNLRKEIDETLDRVFELLDTPADKHKLDSLMIEESLRLIERLGELQK